MINEILYILLQKHELPASDPNYTWLMEADTGRLEQLEAAASAFDCRLLPRQGMIYLIPNQDNLFLGYSKADLKAELLKSNQTDAHYYLSMFALLVLLDAFSPRTTAVESSVIFFRLMTGWGASIQRSTVVWMPKTIQAIFPMSAWSIRITTCLRILLISGLPTIKPSCF